MSTETIVIASGGLDSTVLMYELLDQEVEIESISFDYGQRHKRELEFAARTAERLGIKHDVVDLTSLTRFLAASGSSLVSSTEVPEGHYAEDNMVKTIVPNRNMIMLSIATGIAVARGADSVATAVHAGDHFIYPDCRPPFIEAVSATAFLANQGVSNFCEIQAPFANMTKAQIALRALELNVPIEDTWSCYRGGEIHCGKCGTCVERLEAIDEAIILYAEKTRVIPVDPTTYADVDYWKMVIAARGGN